MLLTDGIIIVAANLECQPSCITPNEATIYKTPYPDLYRESSNLNRFKYSGSVIGKSYSLPL